jgi:holo-[acyl-carrier protein] synthase
MIIGTGTDILGVRRIRVLLDRYGPRFTDRWFDREEVRYCMGKRDPAAHFAGRMAAKEAAAKALKVGKGDPLPWRDILIERNPDGGPSISLSGRILERAGALGVRSLHVSISHCEEYATATVIAEGDGPGGGAEGEGWL